MLSMRNHVVTRGFLCGVVSVGAFVFGDFVTSAAATSELEARTNWGGASLERSQPWDESAEFAAGMTTQAMTGMDPWNSSPAPWSWLEARSSAPHQRSALSWSPHAPLDVFSSHALADRVWLEARAGLVPDAEAWSTLLVTEGANAITGSSTSQFSRSQGLVQAEASLAFVAEFGPRRVSPWRIALGGGWTEADQGFASSLQASMSATPDNADEGEAMIWLRLSREF